MQITIEMACSINGLIATEDGNEDFLSYRGWEIMLEFLKDYDVLIWGRKTWDNILLWGNEYIDDLKNINIIILGNKHDKTNKFSNVTYCSSIDDCISLCKKLNYDKLFISGRATINNAFMEKGIPLFTGTYFENKLKLEKVIKEKDDIVQIHYSIIK